MNTRIGDLEDGRVIVCGLHRLLCTALLDITLVIASATAPFKNRYIR